MKRTSISILLVTLLMFTGIGNVKAAEEVKPQIKGKAAIVMDMETGEIIYENNIDSRQYPASTTKLLTGLLFAESKKKSDEITYTQDAKMQQPDSLDKTLAFGKIKVGDTIPAQEVMDALLVYSANDSAYMIADSVSGDSSKFADLMNDRIKKLGLTSTHFIIPNGLHNDNHYTTPYELSIIGMEAFKNDWVKETLGKSSSKVTTSEGLTLTFDTRNKLLGLEGCIGGKTGYTSKAGRVLVAFFDRNGRKLVGVVMNSEYNLPQDSVVFDDMKKIIDWSYSTKAVNLHNSGDTLKKEVITYKPLRFFGPERKLEVPVLVKEDVKYYDNEVNKAEIKEKYDIQNLKAWSLSSTNPIGTFTLSERHAVKNYRLYTTITTKDIIKQNIPLYIGVSAAIIVLILIITIIVLKIKNKRRRKSRRYYY